MSRLMPDAVVIIIHQRWHNSDLIGRLVDPECPLYDKKIADQWTHIRIPAVIDTPELADALGVKLEVQKDPEIIAQFGSQPIAALWPSRYDLNFFAELRRMNPRRFEALYRGKPRVDDGDFFKQEWLKPYRAEELPKNLRKYMAGDFAVSTSQRADKTCLIPVGVDPQGDIWVLPDVVWRRMDSETTVDAIIAMIQRHKPLVFWAEKGHISQSFGPFLRRQMREKRVNCTIAEKVPVRDKLTRSQSVNALCSMGRVHFPTFAPWWRDAEAEILRFDGQGGGHDDFVDALSWVGIGLEGQVPAEVTRKVDLDHFRSGTLAWAKQQTIMVERDKRKATAEGY